MKHLILTINLEIKVTPEDNSDVWSLQLTHVFGLADKVDKIGHTDTKM